MSTSDKDKLEDAYVNLSQQSASLIHHVSTPIAIARVNVEFLNRYLDRIVDHYQKTSENQTAISSEHLEAIKRAPDLINEQLETIQTRVKAHWQSVNKEVTGTVPNYQITMPGDIPLLDKLLNTPNQAKILLVEDEQIHRDIAVKTLASRYQIELVVSGEDAIERCRQETYELVLMDLYLPGMNGQEAARLIRENYDQPMIIIGLTNMPLGNNEDNEALNAYLSKPLEMQTLEECLEKVRLHSETNRLGLQY